MLGLVYEWFNQQCVPAYITTYWLCSGWERIKCLKASVRLCLMEKAQARVGPLMEIKHISAQLKNVLLGIFFVVCAKALTMKIKRTNVVYKEVFSGL
ncbi:hypothetical protein HanRHA438_Chr16g0775021 [Helianthus annuus]|nr:hypothetical protein HanRHA438_Chr16g0775021 [Helianthus annuus]